MNTTTFGRAAILSIVTLLSACGANAGYNEPVRTAALVETTVVTAQGANMPVPDCAAEQCRGLRIIDANAEAYRYDALRRQRAQAQL